MARRPKRSKRPAAAGGAPKRVRLKKLPRKGHWEVAVVMPPGITDPHRGGELLVADTSTGELRHRGVLSADSGIVEQMTQAAVDPQGPHQRARPRSLRTLAGVHPELVPAAEAMGCKITLVQELPTLDALRAEAGGAVFQPQLPAQVDDWRALLPELVAAAPWEHLVEGSSAYVGGPELDEVRIENDPTVGVPRLIVVPSDTDPQAQLDAMMAGQGDGQLVFWTVELPPVDALGPQRLAWIDAGMVVEHDGVRRALVLAKGTLRGQANPAPGEERRLLAALTGLSAALRGHEGPLVSGRLPVDGAVVRIDVQEQPLSGWLAGTPHEVQAVEGPDGVEAQIVFTDESTARAKASDLSRVDEVTLGLPIGRVQHVELELCSGPRVAALLHVPLSDPRWRGWKAATTLTVVVVGGGVEVARHTVPMTPSDHMGVGHAFPKDAHRTQASDVAGRGRTWPDFAAVMWAFAKPLREDQGDAKAWELAVGSWNLLRGEGPGARAALPLSAEHATHLRTEWRAWAHHDPRRVNGWGLCDDGSAVVAWERVDGGIDV